MVIEEVWKMLKGGTDEGDQVLERRHTEENNDEDAIQTKERENQKEKQKMITKMMFNYLKSMESNLRKDMKKSNNQNGEYEERN